MSEEQNTESHAVETASTDTESTVTDKSAESTPVIDTDVSPEQRRAEAAKHSLGVKLRQRKEGQVTPVEKTDTENVENSDTAEVKSQNEKKKVEIPAIDPDLQKFAESKKLDLAEIANSETLRKTVEMAMNSEKQMNKAMAEQKIREDKIRQKQLDRDANLVVNPKAEADPNEPKAPSEALEAQIQDTFEKLLAFTGISSEAEMSEKYPELYNNFLAEVNAARTSIIAKDTEYRIAQALKKETNASSEATMENEFKKVKSVADDNIAKAKKEYPTLVEDMKKSGLNDLLDEMSEITNVPLEYWMASEKFSSLFFKMSKAMVEVSKLPERDAKTKQQMEKDLAATKAAEMVASGSPVPDDNRTVAQKEINDRKARFQKQFIPEVIN